METALLGVVGWSGSGKTSLLEKLLTGLTAHGKRVNLVKHSHHDVILEPEHKDSARLRRAGAQEVLLASPFRYAIVHELSATPEPDLSELLTRLAPADLTLIEGYKWAPISKLEVFRPVLGKPAIYPNDQHVVAVASDVTRPEDCPEHIIWMDLNQTELILNWLLSNLTKGRFNCS
ncbi:molybdopterin-guanine dinucleotide biosynthesis protein B [Undibacterium danionis]|uniref:Molybdopterin-guanine dinucleotide biosynthesis protein B n=1 Tax=Undibacterium danionis TaxID=1812100 RepID=A0ABV6IDG5_9BURK